MLRDPESVFPAVGTQLLDKAYLAQLCDGISDLTDNMKLLLSQEEALGQRAPEHAVFCKNHQEQLYNAVKVLSTAFSTMQQYEEQHRTARQLLECEKDDIRERLRRCLECIQHNIRVIDDEAVALGIL